MLSGQGIGNRRSAGMSHQSLRLPKRPTYQALSGVSAVALAVTLSCAAVPAASAATSPYVPNARPSSGIAAVIPGPLINHGGPVQTAPRVYLDFWDWTSDPSGKNPYLTNFLSSVGGTPWLATVNQYGGGSPASMLAGTWNDSSPIPAIPTDAQIAQEALAAANHFGVSANVQIVVATPTGHTSAGMFTNGLCAYHNYLVSQPNVSFTNFPYQTDAGTFCGEDSVNGSKGLLDGVSILEGHELAESITDPQLNAWYDASFNELADKCAWTNLTDITTSAGTFAVQPLWSDAVNGCVQSTIGNGSPYEIAFHANNGVLCSAGTDNHGSWGQSVAVNTSPAIASLTTGGYEMAFQGTSGTLWTTGSAGVTNWGLGMAAGTSPAITALPGGGYQMAFQASNGILWTAGTAGSFSEGFGMASDTSPAITSLSTGGYEMAFQASNGALWSAGANNHGSWGLQMGLHTSPSITSLAAGGYEMAVQAASGALWTAGTPGNVDQGLGMASGTSPSITTLTSGAVEMAFQASDGTVWTAGSDNHGTWGIVLAPGTSPSVTSLAVGGYEVAFEASTNLLWIAGPVGTGPQGFGMSGGTSPAIAR